jgi:Peptidase family M48
MLCNSTRKVTTAISARPKRHTMYYCSRRFEYSADREAIKFTGDPEMAIRALAKLHQIRELLAASDTFNELFMTHPTFAHRVGAVVNNGQIKAEHLTRILAET